MRNHYIRCSSCTVIRDTVYTYGCMYVQYNTTAVIIVFFTELFEIKCKRGSRNKFLAVSFFENRLYTSIYVKNNPDKSLGKLSLLK